MVVQAAKRVIKNKALGFLAALKDEEVTQQLLHRFREASQHDRQDGCSGLPLRLPRWAASAGSGLAAWHCSGLFDACLCRGIRPVALKLVAWGITDSLHHVSATSGCLAMCTAAECAQDMQLGMWGSDTARGSCWITVPGCVQCSASGRT